MMSMLSLAVAVAPDTSGSIGDAANPEAKKVSVQAQEQHRHAVMNQYGKDKAAANTENAGLALKASEKIKVENAADGETASKVQTKAQERHQNAAMNQNGKAAQGEGKASAISEEGKNKADASASSESKQSRTQTRTSARKGDSGRGELRQSRSETRSERGAGRSGGRGK